MDAADACGEHESRPFGHGRDVPQAHRPFVPVKRYEFQLRVSPAQYLNYYRGRLSKVVARSKTGENVQFPASLLQKFVTPEGIQGRFVLTVDDNNKCIGLERI